MTSLSPPTTLMRMRCYAATDVGVKRKHNEDAFLSFPELGLWIVADGMGGHASGEVASTIACQETLEQILQGATLTDAIQLAHEKVLEFSEQRMDSQGMGSTIVALKVNGSQFELAWVGDSRAYLFDGSLRLITVDHSYVQELVDCGAIRPEDARYHPQRNIITRSIGSTVNKDLGTELVQGKLQTGESILLCTDGLNSELEDYEISQIFAESTNPQECVQMLIRAAKEAGGSDNITTVVLFGDSSEVLFFSHTVLSQFFMSLNKASTLVLSSLSLLTIAVFYQFFISFFVL